MNLRQKSIDVGRSVSYFSQIKRKSPKLFKKLKTLGNGDMRIGYIKYMEIIEGYIAEIATMYYDILEDENMSLAKFYRIYKKKLKQNSEISFTGEVSRFAFTQRANYTQKGVSSMESIVECYRDYKEIR